MFKIRESDPGTRLFCLGLALALVGYFGPWVGHKTVALTVTGFELAEFAKFFPQAQAGTVPVIRELFLMPLIAAAVLLGLLPHRPARRSLARIVTTGTAVLLALAALPPYQFFLDSQYRGQLLLAVSGLLLVLLTPLARRLPRRSWAILVAFLALVGAAPALLQFALLRPLVVALYGKPPGPGWGLVACTTGFALLLLSGALATINNGRAAQPPP